MSKKSGKKLNTSTKIGLAFLLFVLLIGGIYGSSYLWKFIGGNVSDKQEYLFVRTGSDFEDLMQNLRENEILIDSNSFRWAAGKMNFKKIKPGKYRLEEGMSNRKLINMLKSGNQEPVKLNFQNIRLKEEFAGVIARQLEADSLSIIHLLDSTAFVKAHGFTKDEVYVMFLPNSYELYWNTNAEQFFERMYEEYQKFWTEKKKQRAEEIGLTPAEVSILASIVDSEALVDSEMPTIAGLYLNRLFTDMKLESDPTVIFATKDFSIRRVLNKHLQTASPYNTYQNRGLPPGPISMPSIAAIDAVLNYKKHNYIYMCAKEDFSGYHNFATNITAHLANAKKFQQALNDRNIKK
jgi:UPF0755 protein